jgi:hypothetical protein
MGELTPKGIGAHHDGLAENFDPVKTRRVEEIVKRLVLGPRA